jgi:hypothetical protein
VAEEVVVEEEEEVVEGALAFARSLFSPFSSALNVSLGPPGSEGALSLTRVTNSRAASLMAHSSGRGGLRRAAATIECAAIECAEEEEEEEEEEDEGDTAPQPPLKQSRNRPAAQRLNLELARPLPLLPPLLPLLLPWVDSPSTPAPLLLLLLALSLASGSWREEGEDGGGLSKRR